MVCTSKIQAERVALIGAAKMAKAGYAAVQSPMNPNVWKCIKADGSFYRVEIRKMPKVCGCAFFRANRQFQTCKHVVFIEAEAEALDYCKNLGITVPASTPVSPVTTPTMAYASA